MLVELKTFLAIVRMGTFDKAGEAIGLTQGAVSAQIRRLEEELGKPLFDRVGRRSVLSEFGRQMLPRIEDAVQAVLRLKVGSPDLSDARLMTFGAIYSQSGWLMRALADVRQLHPGTCFRVLPGSSHNLVEQVDAGTLEFAIIVQPSYQLPVELQWAPLALEPYVLLVPERCKEMECLEILQGEPFIRYYGQSFGGRKVDKFLQQHNVYVNQVLESDDIYGLAAAVSAGIGVAIAPAIEALIPLPPGVKAISLEKYTLPREIGIVYKSDWQSGPLVEAVFTALRASALRAARKTWRYLGQADVAPRGPRSPAG